MKQKGEIDNFLKFLVRYAEVYPIYHKPEKIAKDINIKSSQLSNWKNNSTTKKEFFRSAMDFELDGWQLVPDTQILQDALLNKLIYLYYFERDDEAYDYLVKLTKTEYLTDCMNKDIENENWENILFYYNLLDDLSMMATKGKTEHLDELINKITNSPTLEKKIFNLVDSIVENVFTQEDKKIIKEHKDFKNIKQNLTYYSQKYTSPKTLQWFILIHKIVQESRKEDLMKDLFEIHKRIFDPGPNFSERLQESGFSAQGSKVMAIFMAIPFYARTNHAMQMYFTKKHFIVFAETFKGMTPFLI